MNLDHIKHIISGGENNRSEFKKARTKVPATFYDTVCSFANTDGGTILLGVDDDGSVVGVDPDYISRLKTNIITSVNDADCIDPPIAVEPVSIEHDDGIILVVYIPASSQVHNYARRVFVRELESDLDITNDQERIGQLYLRKREVFTESTIYPFLRIKDLDQTVFHKALGLIRTVKSDHPWLFMDFEAVLRSATLLRKDFSTGKEGLTLAAALLFGKDSTIQSILLAYKVEAMVRIQNTDRYDDRINPPLRTNLIDTYLELKSFVYRHLPEKFYSEGDQRIDLRDKIFREVIGNIIIHREYTSALATEIIIGSSEVRVTNPNKPYFHGMIDPTGFNPYPKNPTIRRCFTALGWADEIGSGIQNTHKYLPIYTPGSQPLFIENHTFTTILPLKAVTLGQFTDQIIDWLNLDQDSYIMLHTGLSHIQLPGTLEGASWQDVIMHLVPSWHQKGTQLKVLDWPFKQVYKPSDIEAVPSWDTLGTKLLLRKVHYLITILVLSTHPISAKDLMAQFDYKNEKSFRDKYLKPLRDVKFIQFTIPDNITDPDNKYVITPQGKAFLGGMNSVVNNKA
ncbi:MAG TPA: AAA family ATPase [Bacteroidetes bacterium]|nr:AAA family ATPase [Bacteroidota bacterium]